MNISFQTIVLIIIVSLPVYFLYAWLHKRAIREGFMSRKFKLYLPVLILTPALYVGIILLLFYLFSR